MSLAPAFSLAGRTALVTGSSRGIGAAIALALAEAGAAVAIHSAGPDAQAATVADRARSLGARTAVLEGDLGAGDTPARLVEATVAALGPIDILVLNASVQLPKTWTDITRSDVDRQFAVNYRASFELLQRILPAMAARQWGRVLTIGSVQERVPNPEMLAYSSLKSAQTALALSLARQYAARGVTVNSLAPGVIETDRYHERVQTAEQAARVLSWIPAGYIGQPTDCAAAALLLCSYAGRYITGQNLFVDGGMSL